MPGSVASPGQLIGARYQLERLLNPAGSTAAGRSLQGALWLARDRLAAEAPCALRQIAPEADQDRMRDLWSRLQGVLHPQVPRLGPALREADDLWLVREWQAGRTYGQMLAARAERQMVFGAGEVLLLLRQLLPVLAALHSQELLHGDLSPDNLLRRDSDGLPVLLDFGLVRGTAGGVAGHQPLGATPGYAPPELVRGEPAEPWMDLHALGVVALVLLSGESPAALLDPASLQWRWPGSLDEEPALLAQLQRLLERDSSRRFASAGQALVAFQSLEVPDSTGPVPRADRTVMLVPPTPDQAAADSVAADSSADDSTASDSSASDSVADSAGQSPAGAADDGSGAADIHPAPAEPEQDRQPGEDGAAAGAAVVADPWPSPPAAALPSAALLARRRDEEREEAAEGGLWPVLVALVVSAVVGTAIGWWWLGGGRLPGAPAADATAEQPATLPPGEVDQRQQLLDRLRALQVDRGWFLRLVNASLLAQYPERRGRLPGDGLEDAPLRRVWNDLAEEWLARVQQLPLSLRQRLGGLRQGDWNRRQEALLRQGIAEPVLRRLVSASARNLLPGRSDEDMPEEPYRQLWYAAADQLLESLRVEPIAASSATPQTLSAEVPAGGARLFVIRLPAGHGLALAVNGTPLLQMSVFGADGTPLEANGPLRLVTLPAARASSPVQLIISNDGVAAAPIRLSLRADPPLPAPAAPPSPLPRDPGLPEPGGESAVPSGPENPGQENPAEPAAPAAGQEAGQP